MSRDGFYGIDQSATSAQGPEYTIRARPWMESVPGPLKRGQEKCSCPLLSGPGTNQERLFARFFFQRKRTAAVLDDEVIDEVDKAIALASPEELDRLERPTAKSAPQQPVNFAGESFSGCTINFSFNSWWVLKEISKRTCEVDMGGVCSWAGCRVFDKCRQCLRQM